MPHAYNRIWIHAIWSTKNKRKIIDGKLEPILYDFLKKKLIELGCPVRIINGMPEHIHCLFLLNPQKSITEIIKQLKGSSSRFINKSELLPHKFEWQIGFSAFSVSSQACDIVFKYIRNQKDHHKKHTFPDEYLEFLKNNQLEN